MPKALLKRGLRIFGKQQSRIMRDSLTRGVSKRVLCGRPDCNPYCKKNADPNRIGVLKGGGEGGGYKIHHAQIA